MIVLVVAAAGIGPLAIAAAMSIGQFALWIAAFVVLPRTGVSTVALLAASVRPILVFAVAAAVASVLDRSFFTPLDAPVRLLATGGSWAIVVVVAMALVARRDLPSLWGAVRRR
jgi:PST family polysaccharide transporter